MKVYLASPFFTEEQLSLVEEAEQIIVTAGLKIFSPRLKSVFDKPDRGGKSVEEAAHSTYYKNIKAMSEAHLIVALIEHKDTGTAFEIGWSIANNKQVVLVVKGEQLSKTNLMLACAAPVILLSELSSYLTSDFNVKSNIKLNYE